MGEPMIHIEQSSDPINDNDQPDRVIMFCGLLVLLMPEGDTVPPDSDFYLPAQGDHANCEVCKKAWIEAGVSFGVNPSESIPL